MLFPILFKNIISAITGLIIAFIFEWRTGLLGVIVLPMMMSSGLLLMKYFYENDVETKNIYKLSSSVVT
jgi:ABC-type multidrug transport system fused ATPase/permease subunit